MQVQREGNPLINELIIGTGYKDTFSISDPAGDSQFANFVLDPLLAHSFRFSRNSGYLHLLVTTCCCWSSTSLPSAPVAGPMMPVRSPICCDEHRSIPPTTDEQKRLGFLVGDDAGFPNGRPLIDDVVDIAARAVGGILVDPVKYGTRIGDGVNINDEDYGATFPCVMPGPQRS